MSLDTQEIRFRICLFGTCDFFYEKPMSFGVNMHAVQKAPRKIFAKRPYKRGTGSLFRKIESIRFLLTRDRPAVWRFLRAEYPFFFPLKERIALLSDFTRTTNAVRGYHTLEELLTVCDQIFRRAQTPNLIVVEAGAGSGSSTAKLSLATRIAGGRLFVFDSFRGIPQNDEKHELLDGRTLLFRQGAFLGRLGAVQKRVERFGAIEVCEFHKGLFEDTLPGFDQKIDVALLDVDLIGSTRTCVRHFFPKLKEDGVLFSQDGHLRATVDLFSSEDFWRKEVGVETPEIEGLGLKKLLALRRMKTSAAR